MIDSKRSNKKRTLYKNTSCCTKKFKPIDDPFYDFDSARNKQKNIHILFVFYRNVVLLLLLFR